MMGEDKPKGGLALLLSKDESDGDKGTEALASALSSEILKAVKTDNTDELKTALKNLISYCKGD